MIIDVRPPASFEKETIPGAINIPLDELERSFEKDVHGHFHRLYLRARRAKLAGCEASRRTRIPEHDLLPRQQVERTGLSSGAGEEKMRVGRYLTLPFARFEKSTVSTRRGSLG